MTGGTSLSGIRGTVHGGQQPISGAHLYVYAAGTGGYGGASLSLLNQYSTGSYPTTQDGNGNYYVTTDSGGGFALSGEYGCTPGQQVYLYATQGDSGAGPNSAIGLMAALGQCPSNGTFAASLPFVGVNEVTTIAAAYAMAGFAVDATHVSDDEGVVGNTTSGQAQSGMANAFANAANLVNVSTGGTFPVTPAGNGIVPQSEINTLGNILAACVNTTGPSSSGCSSLLAAATSDGTSTGTRPQETATAAINIAHHPAASGILALIANQPAGSPFQPSLSTTSTPNDFTISLFFSGGGMNIVEGAGTVEAGAIAIDGSGDAWIANSGTPGGITELSSTGAALSPATGYTGGGIYFANDVAIDSSGNAWVSNAAGTATANANGSVTKLSGTGGGVLSSPSTGYTGGGITGPGRIAIDGLGDVWISNNNGTISELSGAGVAAGGSPFSGTNFAQIGNYIAIDAYENVWARATSGGLYKLSNAGVPAAGVPYDSSQGGIGPIAVDASGNVWAGYSTTSSGVLEFSNSGTLSLNSPMTGGGLNGNPERIAIDGTGNVWVSTSGIVELSNAGAILSGSNGFLGPSNVGGPNGIAVDGSGDVWVVNSGYSRSGTTYPNGVSEFIGAASPVVTPLAAGIKFNKLGTLP
jgi:sugar lactone lactonase YvrE